MPTLAPETTAKEIGDAVNALIFESDQFRSQDDPRLVSLFHAAEKLQKVDARKSFSIRGTLSGLCGDVAATHEFFRKALLYPDQQATRLEYWTALVNLALYADASEIGTWLLEPRRHFFPFLWRRAVNAGHVIEVWSRFPHAIKAFPELAAEDYSWLENAVAVMNSSGLTDKQLFSTLDLMGEVQRTHRIMFNGELSSRMRVMAPPEDPAYIHLPIWIDGSYELVHQMNRELAQLVVEKLPNGMFPPGVVGSFQKAPLAEVKAAA